MNMHNGLLQASVLLLVASIAVWSSPVAAERRLGQTHCINIDIGTEVRCIVPASGRTQWFKDCPTCPEMVVIRRGWFWKGSHESETGRSPREIRKRVSVPKSFAVGRFAVTYDEWDACVVDGGCNGYHPPDDGFGRGRNPVARVSWFDANAFTQWLTRKTGKTYRLLESNEREYATRAGTDTAYWWGQTIDLKQANYDIYEKDANPHESTSVPVTTALRRPVPVDSFAANPWGLYNVHGNVWEWTSDCWREDGPTGAVKRPEQRTPDCGQRVARGGSWNDYAVEARSAASIGFGAVSRNILQGFRVARTLPIGLSTPRPSQRRSSKIL